MPASPDTPPSQALGRVTLVTGGEEFLAERVVTQVREQVRSIDPEAEFGQTTGDQLSLASLGELAAPSLFSSTRCVVVRHFEDLPEESVAGVLEYSAAPAEDVALVLVHSGGAKGSGVLTKLRKAGVVEVKVAPPRASELPRFVTQEMRRQGVRVEPEAAEHLVRAVGADLRSLSAAAAQLAGDAEGQPVTLELARRYFEGRAEAKSYDIADAAIEGQAGKALEELRWALERGTAAVLVTSALAGSLRGLARLTGVRRGAREADVAREIGVPPWKVNVLRRQLKGWEPTGLGAAVRAVARADAEVKGAAGDASYSLERMVLDVVRARGRRGA